MRFALAALTIVSAAGLAIAQAPPENQPGPTRVITTPPRPTAPGAPAAPAAAPHAMTRSQRLAYIFKQLEMTPEQRQQADALMESVNGGAPPGELTIEKVREVWAAIQQAQAANDQAAVERYTEQLRQLGKQSQGSIDDDEEFLSALKAQLTDPQKKTLERVVGWLKRNPSGIMRPVDYFDIARELKLSDGQLKQLVQVESDCRRKANEQPPNDDKSRQALGSTISNAITNVLTPDQRTQYETKIKRMTVIDAAAEAKPAEATPAGH